MKQTGNHQEYTPSPAAENARKWRKRLSIFSFIGAIIYLILSLIAGQI